MLVLRRHQIDHDRIALAEAACAGGLVLDIGGNETHTFSKATKTVGWEGDIKINLSHEHLPFDDKSVDFAFCRHTLEDMADPAHLLHEIRRVAKAGYLEIPSPLVETTRGVDAFGDHLGYSHHRWIGCGHGAHLTLCAKYPIIERTPLRDHWKYLRDSPRYWNTHCLFDMDHPLTFHILQHPDGFDLTQLSASLVHVGYLNAIDGLVNEYLQNE